MNEVTVIGEALVDIVRTGGGEVEAPGGSPANVALTLGRLGRRVSLITRFGDDVRGAVVRGWLEASGVDVVSVGAERTSTAIAVLDASGAATYEFDIDWALPDEVDLGESPVVHTGSIATLLTPGADALAGIAAAAARDRVLTFDPNVRPTLIADGADARRRVEALRRIADVVKASDEDVGWLHPGHDPREVAVEWATEGPALVVVTLGGDGAFAAFAGGTVEIPAPRVAVADTVGAGDTFMGALIEGILGLDVGGSAGVGSGAGGSAGGSAAGIRAGLASLDRAAVERLLTRAAAAAAVTVSRRGADPPWADELAAD